MVASLAEAFRLSVAPGLKGLEVRRLCWLPDLGFMLMVLGSDCEGLDLGDGSRGKLMRV